MRRVSSIIVFFFSSRRRHTRCSRDWSSDVCSSDLENALTKQYAALCASDGATLEFTADGVKEIARIAAKVNERMENIGARRLHTVLTTLLEEVLFELPDYPTKHVVFDGPAVRERLLRIVEDEDLRKYIF